MQSSPPPRRLRRHAGRLRRDHRRLRRRPHRSPAGHRAGPADGRRAGAGLRGRDLRPAPGRGRASGVGPAAADRPRAEARAAGRAPASTTSLVVHFDEARSEESPEDFVREVLVGCLDARAVVVGHDFHFGYRRRRQRGPAAAAWAPSYGFDVTGLRLVPGEPGGCRCRRPASASCWREGDVGQAPRPCSAGPTRCAASVQHGDQRGRALGFPTANVAVPDEICLPADGVYAGWYERPDGDGPSGRPIARAPADLLRGGRPVACSRPTCSTSTATSTASRPGSSSSPACAARSRFDSVDDLVEQMDRDVAAARAVLERRPTTGSAEPGGRREPSAPVRAVTSASTVGRPSAVVAGCCAFCGSRPAALGVEPPALGGGGRPGRPSGPRLTSRAAASRAASRARARSRLRAWDRSSLATTRTTGPRRSTSRSRCPRRQRGEAATSKRTSARVFDVLACWPPGPLDAENRHSAPPAGSRAPGLTRSTLAGPAVGHHGHRYRASVRRSSADTIEPCPAGVRLCRVHVDL